MNELPKRKKIRLKYYDYSQNGYYFITVCAKDKEHIFGSITATPHNNVGADITQPKHTTVGADIIRPKHTTVGADIIRPKHIPVGADIIQPKHIPAGADIIRPNTTRNNEHSAVCVAHTELTDCGKYVKQSISEINNHYKNIFVDKYVIMPNHIHMILVIENDVDKITGRIISAPTISVIVGQMKRWVSKQIGFSCWQKSFYEHIIRNEQDYKKICEYIEYNPDKWEYDTYYEQ